MAGEFAKIVEGSNDNALTEAPASGGKPMKSAKVELSTNFLPAKGSTPAALQLVILGGNIPPEIKHVLEKLGFHAMGFGFVAEPVPIKIPFKP